MNNVNILNGCSWVIYFNLVIRCDCNPINMSAAIISIVVSKNFDLWILKYLLIEYNIYFSKIYHTIEIVNNCVIISNNISSFDWVGVFKGDQCVGARRWNVENCQNAFFRGLRSRTACEDCFPSAVPTILFFTAFFKQNTFLFFCSACNLHFHGHF